MKTIDNEKKSFGIFTFSLMTSITSGEASNLSILMPALQQLALLAHAITSLIAIYFGARYTLTHFKRTLGIRKALTSVTGMLVLISVITYALFSLLYLLPPVKYATDFIHSHGYLLLASLILIHYFASTLKNKPPSNKERYASKILIKELKKFTLVIILAIPTLPLLNGYWASNNDAFVEINEYNYVYGENPFWPSQTTTASQQFISESSVGRSLECANCHQAIYNQWQSSAHKHAADDPTYVTNINLLAKNKGIEATRYCEGCHAPIALLSGRLTSRGHHGGIEGTMGNSEGVSCLSCHSIQHVNNLNGVASYHYTPHKKYLFEHSDNILKKINNWLIKASPSQHVADMGRPILRTAKHCSTCHTQFMDKELNDWGWVKMQDEYAAWSKSAFSGNSDQQFSNQTRTICQDCHMPLEKASDPSANAEGYVRSHRFLGANTMLAIVNNDETQLLKTIEFLRSNKLKVTIERPSRLTAVQPSETVDEDNRNPKEGPHYHYVGETIQLFIAVSNIGIGHDFPGGTADINEPWLEVIARDGSGEKIFHSGYIDENGFVDESAHKYVSRPIDRHGNEVWKHDLFNMIGSTYNNTIPSGSTDIVNYSFVIPTWAKSPLLITATLKYRKLNQKYAKWALKENYVEIPAVDMSIDSLTVPLKINKPVLQ